jgi:HEPN domain-containing protein
MPGADARLHAARWLASAEGDLVIARAADRDDDAPPRGAAFFVQQALEKALKSILVWEQIDFPRTHDLEALARLLPPTWDLPLPTTELARITDFAVETRYPGEADDLIGPVTDAEADSALTLVTELVVLITDSLVARGLVRLEKPQ